MFFIPEINPHCILSQIYALFIEFYYALGFFFFFFFKDMHYNNQSFEVSIQAYIMLYVSQFGSDTGSGF